MAAPYRACIRSRSFELSVDESVDAEHGACSTQRHKIDFPSVSRLEPHCGACCNIQAHAIGKTAIEVKRAIDLEEVAMGSDLDGAIAAVGDGDARSRTAGVCLDGLGTQKVFSRNHDSLLDGCALHLRFRAIALTLRARLHSQPLMTEWVDGR